MAVAPYAHATNTRKTSQRRPIPGREPEMVRNEAGGYAFTADVWTRLQRGLILGTTDNAYYANKEELTDQFRVTILEAWAADPTNTLGLIKDISDNARSVNNHAPIYALAVLSTVAGKAAPLYREQYVDCVCATARTASHLYEWLNYTCSLRGKGRLVRRTVRRWLVVHGRKGDLAYQFLKYRSRYDFAARDVLRLFRPNPGAICPSAQDVFRYIVKGESGEVAEPTGDMTLIAALEEAKHDPAAVVRLITDAHLSHEMITGVVDMTPAVWEALALTMPSGALLRHLGTLTHAGVLQVGAKALLDRVESLFNAVPAIKKARLHPFDFLKALVTYRSGGRTGKTKHEYSPVPAVVDILDKAVTLAFDACEPTGKTFLHAVDVSGSMGQETRCGEVGIRCCEIAALMALVSVKRERDYLIRGFAARDFVDLAIRASDSIESASRKVLNHNYGATDPSLPFRWALETKTNVDVVVVWTDGQGWAGDIHATQAKREYAREVNPDVKLIYGTLVPYGTALADPKDPNQFDLVGFDSGTPRVVQMIAKGEI